MLFYQSVATLVYTNQPTSYMNANRRDFLRGLLATAVAASAPVVAITASPVSPPPLPVRTPTSGITILSNRGYDERTQTLDLEFTDGPLFNGDIVLLEDFKTKFYLTHKRKTDDGHLFRARLMSDNPKYTARSIPRWLVSRGCGVSRIVSTFCESSNV